MKRTPYMKIIAHLRLYSGEYEIYKNGNLVDAIRTQDNSPDIVSKIARNYAQLYGNTRKVEIIIRDDRKKELEEFYYAKGGYTVKE